MKASKNIRKECSGCLDNYPLDNCLDEIGPSEECPCKECLVKIVCEHYCDEYINFLEGREEWKW